MALIHNRVSHRVARDSITCGSLYHFKRPAQWPLAPVLGVPLRVWFHKHGPSLFQCLCDGGSFQYCLWLLLFFAYKEINDIFYGCRYFHISKRQAQINLSEGVLSNFCHSGNLGRASPGGAGLNQLVTNLWL